MASSKTPDVVLISDDPQRSEDISGPLTRWFQVEERAIADIEEIEVKPKSIFLFHVALHNKDTLGAIKNLVNLHNNSALFVFPTFNSNSIAWAKDLRAVECLVWPIKEPELVACVRRALAGQVETAWGSLEKPQTVALQSSAETFSACFARCRNGQDLPLDMVRATTRDIVAAAGDTPIETWLEAIEFHHDYTFMHSMFVCFTIVSFAHAIGIRRGDLELLTLGGLLHDIGKSKVPIAILDKPTKLDAEEWATMKRHPEFSREILNAAPEIDRDAVAMAVHHHEKLDGTGYPDGLKGAEIGDLVRLTALADVYSALVDKRSYKPAMPKDKAIDVMRGMNGGLDQDLVRAFGEFVLDS